LPRQLFGASSLGPALWGRRALLVAAVWPCGHNGWIHLELTKVLDKLADQASSSVVISTLVFPGVPWIKQAVVNTLDRNRYLQIETWQIVGFSAFQLARLDGCDDAACGWNIKPLSIAITATGPAGVDQINL